MKKFRKLLVMLLILCTVTFIVPSVSVHAELTNQDGSNGGGSDNGDLRSPDEPPTEGETIIGGRVRPPKTSEPDKPEEPEKEKVPSIGDLRKDFYDGLNNSGAEQDADDGDAEEGTVNLTGKDGALPSKTGYLIYATEDRSIVKNAVAFVTSHGQMPYSTSGSPVNYYLKTRIGGVAPSRIITNLL